MSVAARFGSFTARLPITLPASGRRAAGALRLATALPRAAETTRTYRGLRLRVATNEPAERLLYWFTGPVLRAFEQSYLGNRLRAGGDLFIDVGSNLGGYAVIAAANGWQVIRVEPDPRLRSYHERNPDLGAFLPVAFGAANGSARLWLSRNVSNIGDSSLLGVEGATSDCVEVPVRRGAEALAPLVVGTSGVAVLKVDVEGAEVDVVRGLEDLLDTIRPTVVCEVRGTRSRRAPSTDASVLEVLAGHGYRAWYLDGRSLREAAGSRDVEVYDIVAEPAT